MKEGSDTNYYDFWYLKWYQEEQNKEHIDLQSSAIFYALGYSGEHLLYYW